MFTIAALVLAAALPLALSQTLHNETVLGVYMFHRHGDRTAKITAPSNLTDLGYRQVYMSGQYYRDRYMTTTSPYRISGISPDIWVQTQVQPSAPIDVVLQNSATGFLQALYPPVGPSLDTETLRNGSTVTSPMQGYQLIPLGVAESGTGSEDSTWLQGTTDCAKAEISSNEYFTSNEYDHLLHSTQDFYQRLVPVLVGEYNSTTATFENAYEIFDFINVAEIHNKTIPAAHLLTKSTLFQLRTLADNHEWHLAYNASEPMRAVNGKTLAAQVVQFLNGTIADAGSYTGQKFGIQFGAYSNFASFFGLADLPAVSENFRGVTNYASSMVFEMFTNATTHVTESNFPADDDIYVRFLYVNGTATNSTPPVPYPLFGTGKEVLSWSDFKQNMNSFALGDMTSWCEACGNFTGTCAPYVSGGNSGSSSSSSSGATTSECPNGISPAVNGVIGAFVTLAIILGIEALIMLILGLRLVSKKRLGQGVNGAAASGSGDPKA